MNTITKACVRGYARFLSPIKGYECAHRLHHGGESCSEFYLSALDKLSLQDASKALLGRLKSCGGVARSANANAKTNTKGKKLIIPCVPFI